MTTLLAAARQALPGLEWGAHLDGRLLRGYCGDSVIGLSIASGNVLAWVNDQQTYHDNQSQAFQWLRAQVTARRDALDAALGEKHLGTSAREAWVPVTERLPPLGQEVDLWDGFGRLADCKRDGDESMWDWFNVNGDPIGDVPGTGEPTHWREKPLPPNG